MHMHMHMDSLWRFTLEDWLFVRACALRRVIPPGLRNTRNAEAPIPLGVGCRQQALYMMQRNGQSSELKPPTGPLRNLRIDAAGIAIAHAFRFQVPGLILR